MNLTCPSCGATASANAWENDLEAREALKAIICLQPAVAKAALSYYSLFRPATRALTWKKVKTITQDLTGLVAPGWVQIQGKPARPCPPHLWAQAMEQMVDRSATLSRPLKNHNYLRQIAHQLADQADAKQEQHHRKLETDGTQRVIRPPADPDGMSEIMRKLCAQNGGDNGR